MGAICWCKDEGKAYETISFMRSDWQAIRSIPYMALCDCSWKSPVLSTVQLAIQSKPSPHAKPVVEAMRAQRLFHTTQHHQ